MPIALPLLTIGHGTASQAELTGLLRGAGVELLVDVRTAPGSRRHPHVSRDALERWLPGAGIEYRWEGDLGGFRKAVPGSANTALRHPSFRGYADYMPSAAFTAALQRVLDEAGRCSVAVMCSETLWWRCHRRLIADNVTLLHRTDVAHLGHDGRSSPHRLTEGVRVEPGDPSTLVYDGGADRLALQEWSSASQRPSSPR